MRLRIPKQWDAAFENVSCSATPEKLARALRQALSSHAVRASSGTWSHIASSLRGIPRKTTFRLVALAMFAFPVPITGTPSFRRNR
jgi:hypothetical protein